MTILKDVITPPSSASCWIAGASAPRMFDGSAVTVILWIVLGASLVGYFVRAALAWRRFRHEGVPG